MMCPWINSRRFAALLASIIAVVSVNAGELRIDGIELQGAGVNVHFLSEPNCYYLLWRGDHVGDIRLAADLGLGDGLERFLSDSNLGPSRFYRVEKVSALAPWDTDADGLDDVWELMHRHAGAALNGADANEDHDNNGVADRLDWLRQNLRQGAARGTSVIAAGDNHSLALKPDGSLWAWGGNSSVELGIPSLVDANAPARVGSDTNWASVVAGNQFSYGIRADGTLWAWGGNWDGRLGLSGPQIVAMPTRVGEDTDWVSASGNGTTTVALQSDGTLWSWPSGTTNIPARVGADSNWAAVAGRSFVNFGLKSNGTLWILGSPPSQIGTDTNWSAVAAGIYHALAVKNDGTLWAWSLNQLGSFYGQLGIPGNPGTPTRVGNDTNWVAVSGGYYHSLGLKTDGTVWAWGWNSYGQLGLPMAAGTNLSALVIVSTPTQVGTNTDWIAISAGLNHSIGLHADGTLTAWGDDAYGQLGIGLGPVRQPTQVGAATDWTQAGAGGAYSLGRKADGSLRAWGQNVHGQLGIGSYENTYQPSQIGTNRDWKTVSGGDRHTLAIGDDGSLWAWGENGYGQLGNGTNLRTNLPTRVGTDTNWLVVGTGREHSMGIKADGSLWGWGRAINGTFGGGVFASDTNSPTRVGTETNWLTLDTAAYHTLAVKKNGTLWAWGENSFGVLGVTASVVFDPVQVGGAFSFNWATVVTGEDHTLAIKKDGTLWAWGNNISGQLGTGQTGGESTPVQVGSDTNWTAVAVSRNHSAALKSDGSLWTWGGSVSGALGVAVSTNIVVPVRVGTDTNWVSITAGYSHTVAVKTDGTLWAWGNNSSGQVAQPAVWVPAPVVGAGWGPAPR